MSGKSWKEEFYPIPADQCAPEDALSHSIRKWEGLREKNIKKHGLYTPPIEVDYSTCALCWYWLDNGNDSQCDGCPLPKLTRRRVCNGRQYGAWEMHSNPEPMIALLKKARHKEKQFK